MNEETRKTVTFEDVERRLVIAHLKPYYDWLRHVITLALAALTALVALQGHYVPAQPNVIFLLAIGWGALVVTIVAGLFALRAEYATPLAAAARIRKTRAQYGDAVTGAQRNGNSGSRPPTSHKWAVRGMVASFIVALCSICAFAILNLKWN